MDKRRCAFRIAFGILILLLLGDGVSAVTTITVPDDYARIQWAIDNASAGDTIEVHIGTYFENVNVNKQLTLRGIGMPVVNAGGSESVIRLSANKITLEGFTTIGGSGVVVASNNNVLKGNNASNGIYGILLEYSSNNTLTNNKVTSNQRGIYLVSSNNNTLTNNTARDNSWGEYTFGVSLDSSSNNTLTNNTLFNNHYNFYLNGQTDEDFNNDIDTSNTVNGKPIYYVKNAANQTFDASTNAGTFYCINCINVTIRGLTLTGNDVGVFLWKAQDSKVESVTASENFIGIYIDSSSNNTLINNTASNGIDEGSTGIRLGYSSNNTLTYNTVSEIWTGIGLGDSSNNILTNNNISMIWYDVIHAIHSSNNLIYNNIFNTGAFYVGNGSSVATWNITKQAGTNIVGGSYLAGNYWANPDGTGYSQTCLDYDRDGICNTQYTLDGENIDYLPLSMNSQIKGNVDGDSQITASDALLFLRYAVHQNIAPYHMDESDDVTCDGNIYADDALLVLRKAVNQPVFLTCPKPLK